MASPLATRPDSRRMRSAVGTKSSPTPGARSRSRVSTPQTSDSRRSVAAFSLNATMGVVGRLPATRIAALPLRVYTAMQRASTRSAARQATSPMASTNCALTFCKGAN